LRFVNGISFDGTIDNSGTISGSQNGVYFGNAINGEGADHSNGVFNNEIDGVISSDSRAFNIDGTGLTLNNDGEILGTGNQRNGTIYVDGTATDLIVNNSITGVVDGGAGNESSALSIQVGSNSGDVQSAMIVNEGVLQGRGTGLSAGLRLFNGATDGTSTFSGNISNSGDILAEDTAAILVQSGVIFDGSIDNSGTISSTSGTAVDFSQNDTGITLNLTAGEVDGDILLGTGGDEVNITGGELTSDITGQGSGVVNINLGAGSVFTANAINNVEDYNILSGTVNQVGDFSTAGTTTTIAEGATLAFDSVINGAGALVSNGTLSFSPDSLLIQDGDVTLNEASAIEYLFDDILALDIGEQIELINATSITDNGFIVVDNNLFRDLQAIITDQGDLVIEAIAPNFDTDVNNNTQSFILALGTAIGANGLIGQNVSTTLLDASIDEIASLAPSISGAATLGAYHLNDSVLALIKDNYASGNTNSENRNGLWVQVLGGSSSQDSETIIPGFNSNYDGVGVGYNFQIGNFQIGSSYIYTEANIDNDQSLQSSTVIENDQVVLSGDYQTGSWFLGGSLSIANLDYSFTRATSFGAASANTVGELFDASLSIGYELSSSSATNIAPFASIAYSSLEIDSFNESGGLGINNINYDDVDRLRSELGVIVRVDGSLGNWAVKPNLKFSWKYDFEDENTAFSADIDGAAFNQIGNELDTNILHIGAGILFANKNGWHFRVDFQGDFSENENNQTGSASIEYRF